MLAQSSPTLDFHIMLVDLLSACSESNVYAQMKCQVRLVLCRSYLPRSRVLFLSCYLFLSLFLSLSLSLSLSLHPSLFPSFSLFISISLSLSPSISLSLFPLSLYVASVALELISILCYWLNAAGPADAGGRY
jgi:hypothetical protein